MPKQKLVEKVYDEHRKSLIIHHGDLDGNNGAQVCAKWLETHIEDEHEIYRRRATYENIDAILEAYLEEGGFRYILIVDISITKDLAERVGDNVYIFDHHDTAKYLIGMSPNFYFNEKFCGAVVAWKALFAEKPDRNFGRLMKICNNYDMWQGNDGEPPKISFDMNTLFWDDPEGWYKKFYEGFTSFDETDQRYLDDFWSQQETLWENKIDKIVFDEDSKDVIMLIVNHNIWDANWWSNYLLRHEKYNAVLVVRPSVNKMSLRTSDRMNWFHSGEWFQETVQNENGSKGGHRHAAGCSLLGLSEDEIFEIGINLQETCDAHFRPEEVEA
jgi:oligoribonuclease NrnB/cAMP/cGMP phosphodiesterase (DHH superfamily)